MRQPFVVGRDRLAVPLRGKLLTHAVRHLRCLVAGHPQVSDITALAGLTNLAELSLDTAEVSDIAPLSELVNLQKLDLAITQVSDVRSLARLKKLEQLDLSSTRVTDISPLVGLQKLRVLDLYDTPVSDDQIDSLRKALPNCVIKRE